MNPRNVLLASWARLRRLMGTGCVLQLRGGRRSLYVSILRQPVERFSTLLRLQVYVALAFFSFGHRRLREFQRAPESVQDAFFAQLKRNLDQEREEAAELEETHGIDVPVGHRPIEWDEAWSRRARAMRRIEAAPEADWTPDRDSDPLREIPTSVYVEALTGLSLKVGEQGRCPLPDHDDHWPSFRVYEYGWNCFSCNRGGRIYDLAAILWGIEPRGRGFVEIHKRLRALFDTGLAAA